MSSIPRSIKCLATVAALVLHQVENVGVDAFVPFSLLDPLWDLSAHLVTQKYVLEEAFNALKICCIFALVIYLNKHRQHQ